MYIYIIMLLISVCFILLYEKTKNKKLRILYAIASALPFFVISAFRYDVGTDYFFRYVPDFNSIMQGIDVTNLEIGFKLIVYFCLLFTNNYQLLFIITSAIIIFLFLCRIYRDSKSVLLSICIFFLGRILFSVNEYIETIYCYGNYIFYI